MDCPALRAGGGGTAAGAGDGVFVSLGKGREKRGNEPGNKTGNKGKKRWHG